MAGYICKIVIEDTHPPVWRRVIIPDKITFEELHEIIQILFGWDGYHLHEFQTAGDDIYIGDDEESWHCQYNEQATLIDPFFRNYKWIRYTYDFGDNWRHKINIEKTDPDYTERSVVLLKYKGDNFEEDSGGIWGADDEERKPFDPVSVEVRLANMELPRHDELQEEELLKESMGRMQDMLKQLLGLKPEVLQSRLAQAVEELSGELSPMTQKVNAWKHFEQEESWESLRLILTVRSQKELLLDLGEKEAADYYKYLRIPRTGVLSREEQIDAIAETLRAHPEYLLYIFDEKEYQELIEWLQYPPLRGIANKPKNKNMIIKALGLGLADFVRTKDGGEISFATDVDRLIGVVDAKTKKQIYKTLADFDDRSGKLMQVYCMMDVDSLYEIYHNLYEKNLEKEDFLRYLYWHARFNDFVDTSYQLDGTCYVSMKGLDALGVIEKMSKYADRLPYAAYSRREIEHWGENLANRSQWFDTFFPMLHYRLGMEFHEAEACLIDVTESIMSGDTLEQIIGTLEEQCAKARELDAAAEVWMAISGLMLTLELPMLKGRSRMQYAEEQGCSSWTVGMVGEQEDVANTKERHMYQFPVEVQEWMYEAGTYGSNDMIRLLLDYKEENHICSEEYLYQLAEACITFGQTKEAEQLIAQLKKSSPTGKKAAKRLEERLQQRYDVVDDEDDWMEEDDFSWLDRERAPQPYVRSTPKIGRNDPCPCGSGKKYKKCCGK